MWLQPLSRMVSCSCCTARVPPNLFAKAVLCQNSSSASADPTNTPAQTPGSTSSMAQHFYRQRNT
jgi:hypothetical protein